MNTEVSKKEEGAAQVRRQDYIQPYYQVETNDSAFDVRVYLPGVARDQATVSLDKDTLIVEAHRTRHWDERSRVVHREIPTADYRLHLQLNVHIDENKISATSKDGVLTIHLPVAEEAKPRTIAIQ